MKGQVERNFRIRGFVRGARLRSAKPRLPGWKRNRITGLWEKAHENHNAIVNAGATMILSSIQYGHVNAGKTVRYIAVGSGNNIPAITDTTLQVETQRNAITSFDNTDLSNNPHIIKGTTTFAVDEAVGDIMEAGLFQEATGTPMIGRALFGSGGLEAATKADPCVVTCTGHGLSDGDLIQIEGVAGMVELNDERFYAKVLTPDTFALYTDEALTTSVDSTGYTDFTVASPDEGRWTLVFDKANDEVFSATYGISITLS